MYFLDNEKYKSGEILKQFEYSRFNLDNEKYKSERIM
jgi:hypothetical protein